ncbi:hypothetical protein SAMN05877831_104203 [Rhodobacter maris]|uniref:DDE family transposase n=1 Tax=Rhodobacter maris TaxID=446682 RepID=A0A285SE18_9RHOB|nr:hypothetical protein SAMN05877831_104203 [Rhodobacter maris]
MGCTLVRTIGLVRVKAKIGMKNLAYNMRRLTQLRRLPPSGRGPQAEGGKARRDRAEGSLITSPNITASRFRQFSGGQTGFEPRER